jgi:hypothetical protein
MTEEQVTENPDGEGTSGEIPITFGSFVHSLAMSALVHLGEIPDPSQAKECCNLPLARQTIDLLGVLADKTKGNLEADEDELLTALLYDLRMKFIDASKAP